jgi:hypothetical protein
MHCNLVNRQRIYPFPGLEINLLCAISLNFKQFSFTHYTVSYRFLIIYFMDICFMNIFAAPDVTTEIFCNKP